MKSHDSWWFSYHHEGSVFRPCEGYKRSAAAHHRRSPRMIYNLMNVLQISKRTFYLILYLLEEGNASSPSSSFLLRARDSEMSAKKRSFHCSEKANFYANAYDLCFGCDCPVGVDAPAHSLCQFDIATESSIFRQIVVFDDVATKQSHQDLCLS